jgi:hypothetical protein
MRHVKPGAAVPELSPPVRDVPAERVAATSSPDSPATSVAATSTSSPLRLEQTPESRGFTLRLRQASALPPGSEIQILEDEPDTLCFSYPLSSSAAHLTKAVCPGLVISLVAIFRAAADWNTNRVLACLVYLLPVAGFVYALLFYELGSAVVRLTRVDLDCTWSGLGLRFQSRMAVDDISGIQLGNLMVFRREGSVHRPLPGDPHSPGDGCRILHNNQGFLLSPGCELSLSRDILGCILGTLQAWGVLQISQLPVDAAGADSAAKAGEVIPGKREAASS